MRHFPFAICSVLIVGFAQSLLHFMMTAVEVVNLVEVAGTRKGPNAIELKVNGSSCPD